MSRSKLKSFMDAKNMDIFIVAEKTGVNKARLLKILLMPKCMRLTEGLALCKLFGISIETLIS